MMGTGMGVQGGMMGMMMAMRGGPSAGESPWISFALERQGELGLTPEQIQKLSALRSGFEKDSIRLDAEIRIAELELTELLNNKQADLSKARSKVEQIGSLRTKLRLSRIQALENGKGVLSDQQWDTLRNSPKPEFSGANPTGPEGRGMREMEEFMASERMPKACEGMMQMASQMGGGDAMRGMVHMMDMMGGMGRMGGGTNMQMMGGSMMQAQ